jgi:hypothetical protein
MIGGLLLLLVARGSSNGDGMSLKQIVEQMLDESKHRYIRAIRLYEFQTAIYRPKAFERLIKARVGPRAPTEILRTARILAAIRVLEKIEVDQNHRKSIRDLVADETYCSIFDDVIAVNDGWRRIRHSPSARNFDRGTRLKGKNKKPEAQAAANIVDYSYRFSKHLANVPHGKRKNPGGVDAAKYVVRNSVKPFVSKSSMKSYWRRYHFSAIFLFLMFNQQFDLRPPRVSSKKFLERLLRQTDNIEVLRRFFCAYQTVRAALLNLKYKQYPPLDLDLGCPPPQLDAAEFSPAMKKEFDAWVNNGHASG